MKDNKLFKFIMISFLYGAIQAERDDSKPLGIPYNIGTPSNSVIIFLDSTSSSILDRKTSKYSKLVKTYAKKTIVILSSIQLVMAALGVITNSMGLMIPSAGLHYAGAGIVCGIIFGISGTCGLISSINSSFANIVTLMVLSIIAAVFCIPLLVVSFIGLATTPFTICYAMFICQIIISILEFATALCSSGITCKTLCCKSREKNDDEEELINYGNNKSIGNNQTRTHSPTSMHPTNGYIKCYIPVNQTKAINELKNLRFSSNRENLDLPPKYESVVHKI